MNAAPTYPTHIGADAAKIAKRKQRRLIDTGIIPLRSNDVKPRGSGSYCGLSRARILQTAIAEALWQSGVSLAVAGKVALTFSDCGSTGRAAGQLYSVGKTILLVNRDQATVVNSFADTSFYELTNGATCATVLDLNAVVTHVDSVLSSYSEGKK